jgi:putative Mg2+ transporter-C (MgtC) family protein
MTLLEMAWRLALAFVVGGLVGLERERRDRPAGLRTHMLVCAGSALFTLVSFQMAGAQHDATRIAAQIVSGIGFLGVGTIFRSGTAVRGLTTAAGLWVVAGIGMGVGAGGNALGLAVIAAGLVFATNRWVRTLEDRVMRTHHQLILTVARGGQDGLCGAFEVLDQHGVQVQQVQWLSQRDDPEGTVRLLLRTPAPLDSAALTHELSARPGIRKVEWE